MRSSREGQVFQGKAEGSLLTMEEGATRPGRRAEMENAGGMELGGEGLLKAMDVRPGPPQFYPLGVPSRDSFAQPGSGRRAEVLEGRVSALDGMEDGNVKALGGEPEAGNGIGA